MNFHIGILHMIKLIKLTNSWIFPKVLENSDVFFLFFQTSGRGWKTAQNNCYSTISAHFCWAKHERIWNAGFANVSAYRWLRKVQWSKIKKKNPSSKSAEHPKRKVLDFFQVQSCSKILWNFEQARAIFWWFSTKNWQSLLEPYI